MDFPSILAGIAASSLSYTVNLSGGLLAVVRKTSLVLIMYTCNQPEVSF